MTVAAKPTVAGACLGCGKLVAADAAFCPVCGTRQVPDRPMPVTVPFDETERLGHSANWWLVAAFLAAGALFLAIGILGAVVGTAIDSEGGDGSGSDGSAADTMDSYAPIAEAWSEKHGHVADEASGDDPNGLATAADDALAWIDVNREDLGALAAGAQGASAPLFQELVGIYDERSAVLADIEATATAGGVGSGAASDEMATLEVLDQRADALTCEIGDVMRAEGDVPAEHVTPEMRIAC
ncbi:MAG TPA: zinc ribbon domain-containing protein [Acidimicrobiales bacterium]